MVRALNRNHHLEGGKTYRIGRDPACDITVNDPRVSWAHAVLKVEGANWVLQDLDSSNGTFLGPDRTQRVEITRPCEVRLGHQDNGPVVRFQPQFPTTWAAAVPTPSAKVAADASATRVTASVVDRPTSLTHLGSLPDKTLRIGRSLTTTWCSRT